MGWGEETIRFLPLKFTSAISLFVHGLSEQSPCARFGAFIHQVYTQTSFKIFSCVELLLGLRAEFTW